MQEHPKVMTAAETRGESSSSPRQCRHPLRFRTEQGHHHSVFGHRFEHEHRESCMISTAGAGEWLTANFRLESSSNWD